MPWNLSQLRSRKLPLGGTSEARIAQITQSILEGTRFFPPAKWKDIQDFAPHTLMGSSSDLRRFTDRFDIDTVKLDCLDRSIYVLTELGDQTLTEELRSRLWEVFGVPVYEFYVGSSGLLAFECEAHAGWHVHPDAHFTLANGQIYLEKEVEVLIATGLRGTVLSEPCECGRGGARLYPVRPLLSELPYLAA